MDISQAGVGDVEKTPGLRANASTGPSNDEMQLMRPSERTHNVAQQPFAGRLGGNQSDVLDRAQSCNAQTLAAVPDAAPNMTLAQQFDMRPFATARLWRAGILEGWGTLMFVWISVYFAISPPVLPEPFDPRYGPFNNASFLGPLIANLLNIVLVALFILSFGAVTGAHLNPTITIGTFCARLCSFPRAVVYVGFQIAGASLGGLLARVSYGSDQFKVGGCYLFTDQIPVGDALLTEWVTCCLFLFFAFGVALDPRQAKTIGPALAPWLVALGVGTINIATSFSRYGFGGASLNPARCFGAYVGSEFPSWGWYQWVADISACIVHGVFYHLAPPWKAQM